jgi:hypothetical protein
VETHVADARNAVEGNEKVDHRRTSVDVVEEKLQARKLL